MKPWAEIEEAYYTWSIHRNVQYFERPQCSPASILGWDWRSLQHL